MALNPFKRHRFPPNVILLAVRWYCRYPLSYLDVRDLLTERGVHVNATTINRWIDRFQKNRYYKATIGLGFT